MKSAGIYRGFAYPKGLEGLARHSGQAAIEFIVVVVVILFFLLFFLSLSITLVVSNYIDYATFMAARTYKAGYDVRDTQIQNAREVFFGYANKVAGIARNFTIDFQKTDPNDEQTDGVITSFDIDLFYLPPVFVSDGFPSRIKLFSEAHLGRDPGTQECLDYFKTFSRRLGLGIDGTGLISKMEDNGC